MRERHWLQRCKKRFFCLLYHTEWMALGFCHVFGWDGKGWRGHFTDTPDLFCFCQSARLLLYCIVNSVV